MMNSLSQDRQVLEFVKNNEHFVLVYPNTRSGRVAAKGAVWNWLIDCELDFNRHDAELFQEAIVAGRSQLSLDRLSARDMRSSRPRI